LFARGYRSGDLAEVLLLLCIFFWFRDLLELQHFGEVRTRSRSNREEELGPAAEEKTRRKRWRRQQKKREEEEEEGFCCDFFCFEARDSGV
jgi:hypothetical protein